MTTLRTLMIVDDDPVTRRSLTRALNHSEYEIIQAGSAERALEILATTEVHLVIADYHMGGMDGATFLSQVERRHPNVVRLLLTSDSSTEVIVAAVNDGRARRVLYKPWQDEQLCATVRQCVGLPRHPARRPNVYSLRPMGQTTVNRLVAMLGVEISKD